MMSKEETQRTLEKIKLLIEGGKIDNSDINQIAMDRAEEYIDNYDKIEEIERRLHGLIQIVNQFGSHNRQTLMGFIFMDLNKGIPIDPNARIGILENVKQFIYDDTKEVLQ